MKLTRASDFALRLLRQLSRDTEGSSALMAQKLGIPFNHLAKIVQRLNREGFIIAKKGKGGGLRLARPAAKIKLSDVIEAMEGPFTLSDCLLSGELCQFSHSCKLRRKLRQARDLLNDLFSGSVAEL